MTEEEDKRVRDEMDARCNRIARAEADVQGALILLMFSILPVVILLATGVWRWFVWMGWCDD